MQSKMYPNCCAAVCLVDLSVAHVTGHLRYQGNIESRARTVTKAQLVKAIESGYYKGARLFTAITAVNPKDTKDQQLKVRKLLKRLGFKSNKGVVSRFNTVITLHYLTIGGTDELEAFKTHSESVKG